MQNFVTSDDNVAQSDVDLRIVLVHLDTEKKVVVDIKAGETKSIGKLTAGHWAVVMTRKIKVHPVLARGLQQGEIAVPICSCTTKGSWSRFCYFTEFAISQLRYLAEPVELGGF